MTPFLRAVRGFEPTVAAFTHASAFALTWRNATKTFDRWVAATGIRRISITQPFVFPMAEGCDKSTMFRFAFNLLIVRGKENSYGAMLRALFLTFS